MLSRLLLILGFGLCWIVPFVAAWVPPSSYCEQSLRFPSVASLSNKAKGPLSFVVVDPRSRRAPSLVALDAEFGGFGGFGGTGVDKGKRKKETKLKPKQQWDRYIDLKKENRIRVAVRVVSDDGEWLEVGNVKSKDNKYTEIALARQRALVAEHGRRLFPLQISTKDTVSWAFWNEESEEWTVVDKSVLEDPKAVPANVEKLIGFEGRPDPSSGFYCLYNEGRITNADNN